MLPAPIMPAKWVTTDPPSGTLAHCPPRDVVTCCRAGPSGHIGRSRSKHDYQNVSGYFKGLTTARQLWQKGVQIGAHDRRSGASLLSIVPETIKRFAWKEGTLIRKNLRINTYCLLLACLVALGGLSCGKTEPQAKRYSIAVIPKGTTHEFWKAIHAGAVKAEQELSGPDLQVSITWKGPLREDDREQQIQVVEGFLSQGVSGIVLAPLDNRALVRPVEEAAGAGIPTVIIDSALDSSKIISFVATDNLKGGEIAADRMAELLHGKGKVLLLRYQEGSAS